MPYSHSISLKPVTYSSKGNKTIGNKFTQGIPHISFSRAHKNKSFYNTKNFIVLSQGIPLRDKVFNIKMRNAQDQECYVPLFKTDADGLMHILMYPTNREDGFFNAHEAHYCPLKYSERLGFVVKDYKKSKSSNLLYRTKILGRYIDFGISEHFLRSMIVKSDCGKHTIDATNNMAIRNWVNANLASDAIRNEYDDLNGHTEKTTKSTHRLRNLSYALMAGGGMGILAIAPLSIVSLVPFAAIAIPGTVFGAGSLYNTEAHYFKNIPKDISRPSDSVKTAKKSLLLDQQTSFKTDPEQPIKNKNP